MELKKCPRCGKLFAYSALPICDACLQKEEADFVKVRDYLREYPNSGLKETCEDTEVSENLIIKFLKEGRLISTNAFIGVLSCERCGKHINSGRFCEKCIVELKSGFYRPPSGGDSLPINKNGKMHINARK
jgi:flagellar operon protein (TIGR03826 family)